MTEIRASDLKRWGEFKAAIEACGVTDADTISYIDWSSYDGPPHVVRDDHGEVTIT